MGLFDFFKKTKVGNLPQVIVPGKPKTYNSLPQISNCLPVHKDIENLLWIADGVRKNYSPQDTKLK